MITPLRSRDHHGPRRGRTPLVVLLVLAATCPSAALAAPVRLSADGQRPDIAVDASNTGHIVWNVRVDGGSDLLHYCRLPRGAGGCSQHLTFTTPGSQHDFNGPRVLIGPAGQIHLVTQRCCSNDPRPDGSFGPFGGGQSFVFTSTDGGASFAGPAWTATLPPSGDILFGPGDFQISSVTSVTTGGTFFQAAPLSTFTSSVANVGDAGQGINNPSNDGTVALVDPLTPIVAFDDLERAFFRLWSGSGNLNDLSTWGQMTAIPGAGVDTRLAYGRRGVFLQTLDGAPGARRYVVRRWGDGAFAAPVPVTAAGSPIFGDLSEDGSGRLHSVWRTSGTSPVLHRYSDDGRNWRPGRPEILGTAAQIGDAFNLRVATAPDGGGWTVIDRNGRGPVHALPVLPRGGTGTGTGTCPESVTFGVVTAEALDGCFAKRAAGGRQATGPVRVNGVDLIPVAGAGASAAATTLTIVDTTQRRIRTTGSVRVRTGPVELHKGTIDWTVAASGTKRKVTPELPDVGGSKLLGFPIDGDATIVFTAAGAEVPTHVRMPSPFDDGVTADITIRTAKATGLITNGMSFSIQNASMGPLGVVGLKVTYKDDPGIFTGDAQFVLPPGTGGKLKVAFGFLGGAFAFATASLEPPAPIPVVPPFVALRKIDLALSADPRRIAGGIDLIAGKPIGGVAAVSVDALSGSGNGLSLTLPASGPAILRAQGKVRVVGIPIGGGAMQYSTDGILRFGGFVSFDLGPAGIFGGIKESDGVIDLTSGAFNAQGSATVSLAGTPLLSGGVLASSKGIAACGSFSGIFLDEFVDVSAGVGYTWGAALPDLFAGCDLSGYKVKIAAASAGARAAQAPGAFTVTGNQRVAAVRITGAGGPPSVLITGPDGRRITTPSGGPPTRGAGFIAFADPRSVTTYVLLARPPAGTWTVAAQPGSPPVTRIATARGLAAPRVRARVGGRGRARTLRYRVRVISGQRVTFTERTSGGVTRVIGMARGATGTLRFRPADVRERPRRIVALVEQDGMPRTERLVARYTAPPRLRPGRPRSLRVRRSGTRLRITWRRAAAAVRYRVIVRNARNGTTRMLLTRRTRVAVAGVEPGDRVDVRVRGLRPDGSAGPPARRVQTLRGGRG